jgi:hypothetical protein
MMPRKQRFKPSRKPKPVPVAQTQEGAVLEQSGAQREEASRTSAADHIESMPEPRATQRREEMEAG